MVWNSKRILIKVLNLDVSDEYQLVLKYSSIVGKMQRKLHHKYDDPRWQVWPGNAKVIQGRRGIEI